MKKLICLVLAALLCVGAVAMAETGVPSKSTADMAKTNEVKSETGVEVKSDFVLAPASTAKATAEQTKVVEDQIAGIVAAGSVESYFGALEDEKGTSIDLKAVLGTDKPVVNEVMPLVVENYDSAYGSMTASFTFSTPYKKDEPVVIVIRIVDPKTGKVKQVALQSKGNGVDGGIDVEFPAEVLEAIQGGNATMAVVSK